MKEIQLLRYVSPMGMCSGSHRPPPSKSQLTRSGKHHIDKGRIQLPLPPIYPPSTPAAPKTTAPNLGLIPPLYCVRGS